MEVKVNTQYFQLQLVSELTLISTDSYKSVRSDPCGYVTDHAHHLNDFKHVTTPLVAHPSIFFTQVHVEFLLTLQLKLLLHIQAFPGFNSGSETKLCACSLSPSSVLIHATGRLP